VSDEVALFGRALGRALGNGPPQASFGVQRANFLAAAHRMGRQKSSPRWGLAFAFAAVFAVAIGSALFAFRKSEGQALLRAHFNGHEVRENAELAAPTAIAKPLEFSDGSKVVFEPSARAKLSLLGPKRAALRLNQGRFTASIVHRPGMTWGVDAGPYRVEVVGTKFSVDWQGGSDFRVEVTEGTVHVTGGDLAGATVLRAGQRLERTTRSASNEAAETKATPTEQRTGERAATAPTAERTSAGAPGARDPSYSALASAGKYRQALELAEKQGFERVIGEIGENDLLGLANSARYAGSPARARQALLKLRDRFPGRPAADLAALYLARIAEQSEHRPQEAVRWLRTFLSESPTGDLAQSARASLLSILSAQGDTAGARAVAEDYLRYHPEGPLAEQARSLVSRTTPP
jgi:tetratricopeptide (TPR) repeat protein